jgi:hypothetical protein
MVEPDLPLDGVHIHLRRRLDVDQVQVMGPLTLQLETHIVDEAAACAAPPMLRLPDDMAAALLRALAAYYGNVDGVQAELTRLADLVEVLGSEADPRVSREYWEARRDLDRLDPGWSEHHTVASRVRNLWAELLGAQALRDRHEADAARLREELAEARAGRRR